MVMRGADLNWMPGLDQLDEVNCEQYAGGH